MTEKEETRSLVGVGRAAPSDYIKIGKLVRLEAKAERAERAKAASAEAKATARAEAEAKAKSRAEAKAAKAKARAEASQQAQWVQVGRGCGSKAMKTYCEPVVGYPVPFFPDEPRRACSWLPFLRRDPEHIRAAKALKAEHDEFFRRKIPRSQIRAMNQKTVLQCLEWYNSKHPGDQYEPAPGEVTRRKLHNKSLLWTHGNFVARRKSSGCFSFLHAPRTLFFFELLDRHAGAEEVITCTPIDEPVTEAYTFLGLPLGWGTRRHGGADCVCKTCYRQFHVPHIGLKRTCACGDSKVESVCKMCYLHSCVVHPVRGGFTFGQEDFPKSYW